MKQYIEKKGLKVICQNVNSNCILVFLYTVPYCFRYFYNESVLFLNQKRNSLCQKSLFRDCSLPDRTRNQLLRPLPLALVSLVSVIFPPCSPLIIYVPTNYSGPSNMVWSPIFPSLGNALPCRHILLQPFTCLLNSYLFFSDPLENGLICEHFLFPSHSERSSPILYCLFPCDLRIGRGPFTLLSPLLLLLDHILKV